MKITQINNHTFSFVSSERILIFQLFGIGLIPMHPNPSMYEDFEARSAIKEFIFGKAEMQERRKAINK